MEFSKKIEQFLRYLEAQTKINDQQLIGFSDISALFIAAVINNRIFLIFKHKSCKFLVYVLLFWTSN